MGHTGWVNLLAATLVGSFFPKIIVSQLEGKSSVNATSIWTALYHSQETWWVKGTEENRKHMLPAVPLVTKYSASEPAALCLLPASLKSSQANLLACKLYKI